MDTDEQPAHFAWDLLDSAKRVAEPPPGPQKQVAEKRITAEPARRSQPSEAGPTGLSMIHATPTTEASPIVQNEPPATVIPPAPDAETGEPSAAAFQQDPALEKVLPSAREPEPEPLPGRTPMIEQRLLPVRSDGDIPKLSWVDVGTPAGPGQYRSRYGLVEVRAEDIWIWKMHPNAAFVVMQPSPYSEQNVSWLGSFDLGNQEHFAEDQK